MKPASLGFYRVLVAAWMLVLCTIASAVVLTPRHAEVAFAADLPAPGDEARWQQVGLPFESTAPAAWVRFRFDAPAPAAAESLAVYLPYLYGGGRLLLNRQPLAYIEEASAQRVVRWERPHLVAIPPSYLRAGSNELLIRVSASPIAGSRMPLPEIGPYADLLRQHDRRLFWVRSMSQFTVIACGIVGALSLFIWWRRREESAYGQFGAAALLWGLRTLTLVVEGMPAAWWHAWRTLYHAATGGFTIVMLMFAMSLAGMRNPRLDRLLFAYWLLGPLAYVATGGDEFLVGRVWTGGLLPVGFGILAVAVVAARRQRSPEFMVLAFAIGIAVLAGVHDYLLVTRPSLLPQDGAYRVFVLHHAADLLLLVMGGILSVRLVATLRAIEQLNRTLEERVAERQAALLENYERVRALERRQAAGLERQQIMRDLHDGVGSKLFIALCRAELDSSGRQDMVQAVRDCIAEMRLTLEALTPDDDDFLAAWSTLRARWQASLEGTDLVAAWETDADDEPLRLSPHVALQLLRIVQEALTNVVKHAHASEVVVRLHAASDCLSVSVRDNGRGLHMHAATGGRGLANMRARAGAIGARLEIANAQPGLLVTVRLRRGT